MRFPHNRYCYNIGGDLLYLDLRAHDETEDDATLVFTAKS